MRSKVIKVICPYCGLIFDHWIHLSDDRTSILTCPIDDANGCDKQFVVKFKVNIDTESFKIESK